MKISLQDPYIIKKVEASSFKTVLASTFQTAYRLYLITNGIKELQTFYETDNKDYYVFATVKTEAALVGEARSQAWNVKHLQPLLLKKPRFSLRCSVTENKTGRVIYRNTITSIRKETIFAQVQRCIEDLDNLLETK